MTLNDVPTVNERVAKIIASHAGLRQRAPVWVLITACLVALAGCPIGCPKGKQQTLYEGPVEEINLQRLGPCTYRAEPPLKVAYRYHEGRPPGAYFVMFDGEIAFLSWVTYEPATAVFTIKEPFCSQGATKLTVDWHPLLSTVNE